MLYVLLTVAVPTVTVQPDRCMGVLDTVNHGGMAIESIQFTGDRRYVGTLTHDTYIRLLDANLLDGDEEKNTNEALPEQRSTQTTRREARDSDDEWADADEDEESEGDDSDDDDDSEEEDPRRRKRLKTASERFFDDL